MEEKSGWKLLLEDVFFKHRYISNDATPNYALLERVLVIIHSRLFSEHISFSTENNEFQLPNKDNDKETLGFNATLLQNWLKAALTQFQARGAGPAEFPCLNLYLNDRDFQDYVDILLSFINTKAKMALPKLEDTLPSREEREEDTQRENDLELTQQLARQAETAQRAAEAAQSVVERGQRAVQKARIEVKKAQKAVEKAQEAAESIIPNMLTTLGVFIAIVIAVVGCYLSLLLTQHIQNMRPLDLTMILVMGHVLINIIFLLLYLIAKLSGHPVACNCPAGNCPDCGRCQQALQQHCNWMNKLWLRYPYMVALNSVFFLAYLGFGAYRLLGSYWEGNILPVLQSNWLTALFWALVALSLLVFFGVRLLRSPAKRAALHAAKAAERQQKRDRQESDRNSIRQLTQRLEQLQAVQTAQQGLLEELRRELDALAEQQQKVPAGVQPPPQ